MPRANRNFGDDPSLTAVGSGLDHFNPGNDDAGVIRQGNDGRDVSLGVGSTKATNVALITGGPGPGWDDPMSEIVECE